MEEKGLARAVAALRAELHSFNVKGARIVIEVSAEQWHAMRVKLANSGAQHDVAEVTLVTDVVNGHVVIRPAGAGGLGLNATAEQLEDLGLQPSPKTDANKLEAIERQLAALLQRIDAAPVGGQKPPIQWQITQLANRVDKLERQR